ncbi:uncharacterized protein METZ01_LOCUS320560 [marine metagenome]|uniref:Uncharacterized protein n=1 Tax=marine metagenome TaxID=408172 RepID=A0A382P323_9ZZZZ
MFSETINVNFLNKIYIILELHTSIPAR